MTICDPVYTCTYVTAVWRPTSHGKVVVRLLTCMKGVTG